MSYSKPNSIYLNLIFCFLLTAFSFAQKENSKLIKDFQKYAEAPREVAYVHLNKSTYIEGEMLGFTAYVFDKASKTLSSVTSNLYCTIANSDGKVLKEKLIKVTDGIASNVFYIDSTLSTGIFTFKAYTNWMRNFEEQNHYEQTFKIIDADNLEVIKPLTNNQIQVDLQVLGEGGHLLYNVPNSVGIIAKNQFGSGIANALGTIKNSDGDIVSNFQLNNVGLAKALFTPLPNQNYTAELNYNGKTISKTITDIKLNGIVMSLTPTVDNIMVMLKTNTESLKQIKKKTFKIGLHNGDEMTLADININKEGTAVVSFAKDVLFSGINIFTVFDGNDAPILERLFFNTQNINHKKITDVQLTKSPDSLNISLSVDGVDTSKWSNVSVSALPTGTNSYNHHNNLLSQLYIQPYINGTLEKAGQYFSVDNIQTQYNLDLLMLTQGWSSYNWTNIFNAEDSVMRYPFEQGIDITTNVNDNRTGTYLVYPLSGKNTQLFDVKKEDKSFSLKGTYPTEDDIFRISYLKTDKKPSVYSQFYPAKIPNFTKRNATIIDNYKLNDIIDKNVSIPKSWNSVEKLDEVVVETRIEKTRAEALANKTFNSRVAVLTDRERRGGMRIDIYLQRLGWQTFFDIFSGNLSITNPRVTRGNPVPAVYVNDALIGLGPTADFSLLTFIWLDEVDYIEYELYGIGGGLLQGEAGFIKIVTSKEANFKKRNKNSVVTYDIPLRFNGDKTFYTPKYQYYNTPFFKEYGTIAWQPNVKVDNTGKMTVKIVDTKTENISLFVEGIVNGNQYISQEIKIETTN